MRVSILVCSVLLVIFLGGCFDDRDTYKRLHKCTIEVVKDMTDDNDVRYVIKEIKINDKGLVEDGANYFEVEEKAYIITWKMEVTEKGKTYPLTVSKVLDIVPATKDDINLKSYYIKILGEFADSPDVELISVEDYYKKLK